MLTRPGLNVNRGQRILLRLRYPGDANQFVPIEQVIDTMLHELSHIVHGPHDEKFHRLWNQLRDEHEGLVMKGYTGEGFLSKGQRLGGKQVPMTEARRLARAAAEKRRAQPSGSGQRLGGSAPRPGSDIRKTIVKAIDRRNNTLKGCGNTNHNDKEIREISETATRNGFRTQAEEDAANEAAIAQALWELVQEDEKRRYGNNYIHPSPEHPAGNGGWSDFSQQVAPSSGNPPLNGYYDPGPAPAPVPVPPAPAFSAPPAVPPPRVPVESRPSAPAASSPGPVKGWTCSVCTLHNPREYLCCDVCGAERPAEESKRLAERDSKRRTRTDPLPRGNTNTSYGGSLPSAPPTSSAQATWMCSFCGNVMERQWWTCSTCGKMKDSSR